MVNWEYHTFVFQLELPLIGGSRVDERELGRQLNHWGAQGWEMVSMVDVNMPHGATGSLLVVMKRVRGGEGSGGEIPFAERVR